LKARDSLREAVLRAEKWEEIDKRIAILQGKMHNERQFNRQVEMHEEIKRLVREKRSMIDMLHVKAVVNSIGVLI
jgi:hypothetical protein